MDEMQNSAGSAMAEFEMVQETVQYKLNQLKETWTGVAINLFDTDQMGAVVDVFTRISEAIAAVTEQLGLFGTAVLGFAGAKKVFTISAEFKKLQDVAGFDTWTTGKQLAEGLKKSFPNVTEYFKGLARGIKEFVPSMKSTFDAATAGGMNGLKAAIEGIKGGFLGTADAAGAFATAVSGVIGAAVGIAAVVGVIDILTTSFGEAKEKAEESRQAYEEQQKKVDELNAKLGTTQERIAELDAKPGRTLVEQAELDKLETQNALLEHQIELEKILAQNKQREATDDTDEYLTKESFFSWGDSDGTGKSERVDIIESTRRIQMAINELKNERREYENQLAQINDPTSDAYKNIQANINSVDYQIGLYTKNLTDQANEINEVSGALYDSFGNVISGHEKTARRVEELNQFIVESNKTATEIALEEAEKGQRGIENFLARPSLKKSADSYAELVEGELKKLEKGGGVNLTLRPAIDTSKLKDAGWEDAGGGTATVFSSTYSDKTGTKAINFTPIIADPKTGEFIGVLSPDELQEYAEEVIAGTREDDLNLQMGAVFEGDDAIEQAEAAAEKIHEYQEMYYMDDSLSLVDKLTVAARILNGMSVDQFKAQFPDLANAVDAAGLKIDDVVNHINSGVEVAKDNIESLSREELIGEIGGTAKPYENGISLREFESWLSSLSDEELKIVYSIVASQDTGAWTMEDYQVALQETREMVAEGINIDVSVGRKSGAIRKQLDNLLNVEDFEDVQKTLKKMAETVDGITADSIIELAEESETLAAVLDEDGMSAQFLAHVLQTELTTGNGFALITDDMLALNGALEGLAGRFDEVTAARQRYNEASSKPEKDDDFKSYAEAFETLQGEFDKGYTNSNSFWAAAEYLFGADQLRDWGWSDGLDKIKKSMQQNEKVFKDADSAGYGFLQRLDEITNKEGKLKDENDKVVASIEKLPDGGYNFEIDNDSLDLVAEKMGITEEAALACLEALSMLAEIDFTDTEEVIEKLENLDLASTLDTGNVAVNLDGLTEALQNLGYSQKAVDDVISKLREAGNISFISAKAEIDELTKSFEALGVAAKVDGEIRINAEGLSGLLADLGFAKEDVQELYAKLDEAGIKFTDVEGNVIAVEEALKELDKVDFGEVEESAEDLKDTLGDVAETDMSGLADSFDLVASAIQKVIGQAVELGNKLAGLNGTKVNVDVNVNEKTTSSGSGSKSASARQAVKDKTAELLEERNIPKFASGTGKRGGAPGGKSLVGEEGAELVLSGDRAYLAGQDGPEIVNLKPGDTVYTAEQTKKIRRGTRKISGAIPAFVGGTGIKPPKIGDSGGSGKSTKDDEDKVKETADSMQTVIDAVNGGAFAQAVSQAANTAASGFEELYKKHQHLLAMDQETTAEYLAWLEVAYKDAYDAGQIELDDFYKYEEEVFEKRKQVYEEFRQEHENAIKLNENWRDHASENGDLGTVAGSTREIISRYRAMQESLHEQAEYYRSLGYSDTSDEVSELSDLWWDYYDDIREASEEAWEQITENAHDAVDEIQDAYEALRTAASEYNKNGGKLSVDTYQSLLEIGPKYLELLRDENGELAVNEDRVDAVLRAKTEEMSVNTALAYVERVRLALLGESNEGLSDVLRVTEGAAGATWDLVYANAELLKSMGLQGENFDALISQLDMIRQIGLGAAEGVGSVAEEGVEEYIAELDKYREAKEKLRREEERNGNLSRDYGLTDDLRRQILLQKELTDGYVRQQEALHVLNNERDRDIRANVEKLRGQGFEVEYDDRTNQLWIRNLEHLNELQAETRGEYGSMQEATNALRQETEELISATENLNEENRDGSAAWWDLEASIQEARREVASLLGEVYTRAAESVDTMQGVYSALHEAADEYASTGHVTVDTLQSILEYGPQYMAYLMDENGKLVINEKRIRDVIKAKVQQMGVDTSLAYIESLRLAKLNGDNEALGELLQTTQDMTDAQWGLVYATLKYAGLSEGEEEIALNNINAIRALTQQAMDDLDKQAEGVGDIIEYVQDMIKHQIQEQIDDINEMVKAYQEYIDRQKEALDNAREQDRYEKSKAEKLREIAKLQARIDILGLDDSREAQAERVKLQEELAELQDDLNETQADKAVEVQKEALDKMSEDYADQKQSEIEALQESISSEQKLYDMAVQYIRDNWDTLKADLLAWNYEVGSNLQDEICSAWDKALESAQQYGDYVRALKETGNYHGVWDDGTYEPPYRSGSDSGSGSSGGGNAQVGRTVYDQSYSKEQEIHAIIKQMWDNSQAWAHQTDAQRKASADENLKLGRKLNDLDVPAWRDTESGVWYVGDRNSRLKLFDLYSQYIYHTGGIVGGGTAKEEEQFALLKKREWVLDDKRVANLVSMIEKFQSLSKAVARVPELVTGAPAQEAVKRMGSGLEGISGGGRTVEISFGGTVINGVSDEDTVARHIEVDRKMVNEIARILRVRA